MPSAADPEPRPTPQPTTPTGTALVSWVRPNLRRPYADAVARIEREAARAALAGVRARLAQGGGASAEVLAAIDDAIDANG